jgi:hypothetical protein
LSNSKRPSSVHPALTWRLPRHPKKKKKFEFVNGRQKQPGFISPHFPPSRSFSPSRSHFSLSPGDPSSIPRRACPSPSPSHPPSRLSLSPSVASRSSAIHPARDRKRVAPLSLPVRRVSISGDPRGTQTVLFSGNPPTTQSVLFSGDPPTTCSPATQTVIRVFWVFFFLHFIWVCG